MYQYTKCPVCRNAGFKPYLTCEDHAVSHEKFNIVSCDSCGFKFTNPIPDTDRLGDYYKSEDYISHSDTKKGVIARLYHRVRSYTLKAKLAMLETHVSRGTVLDYGCGTGMFLETCKEAGWQVIGMEPDPGASSMARNKGLIVYGSKQEIVDNDQSMAFEAITLWHVLEHVTDLRDTLEFFKARLSPSGLLIIAVPNHSSFDAKFYKEHWAAYDVPRHLYHFVPATLEKLMGTYGFSLRETRPMKFDSFYVSMLSEKYKTGTVRYLKAFVIGLTSNLKARSPREYSSVIYIFGHKS